MFLPTYPKNNLASLLLPQMKAIHTTIYVIETCQGSMVSRDNKVVTVTIPNPNFLMEMEIDITDLRSTIEATLGFNPEYQHDSVARFSSRKQANEALLRMGPYKSLKKAASLNRCVNEHTITSYVEKRPTYDNTPLQSQDDLPDSLLKKLSWIRRRQKQIRRPTRMQGFKRQERDMDQAYCRRQGILYGPAINDQIFKMNF